MDGDSFGADFVVQDLEPAVQITGTPVDCLRSISPWGPMIESLFPSVYVAMVSGLLAIARFENQRWVRAPSRGVQGRNPWPGLFATFTGFISIPFGVAFLVSYGWQFGWPAGLGLILITVVVPMIWTIAFSRLDNIWIWIIGTIAIWPLMIRLALATNWFGLVH